MAQKRCKGRGGGLTRHIHIRVSDGAYERFEEEAAATGTTVANFCREAAIGRAALYAYKRGELGNSAEWRDVEAAVARFNAAERGRVD